MNVGESVTFDYTQSVQTFTVPNSGVYKLECWGAGTYVDAWGGVGAARGGYASGYAFLKKGLTLYICVGGLNGYNGGGSGAYYHDAVYAYFSCTSGGGATHIAKVGDVLSNIGENSFCVQGNGFLIAGGAGGSESYIIASGTTGTSNGGAGGTGGSGGGFGYGRNGASGDWYHGCGGGGGYRGGNGSSAAASGVSGGGQGGTSWVGNVATFVYKGVTYSPSTTAGARYGNGQAKITLMDKASFIKYGTKDTLVYYRGEEMTVYEGDRQVG